MSDFAILAIILGFVSMVRVKISHWPITGPMIFVGMGMLLSSETLGVLELDLGDEGVVITAELTLALLLFSDAARIDAATLRSSFSLPGRLLGIGLPLSIAFGTVLALTFLGGLSWQEAALISAILAPTDAALGQAVVSDSRVPVRIRQTLNVESGLNDGLAVPVVAVFAALATGDFTEDRSTVLFDAVAEISIGVACGLALGAMIGTINPWVQKREWTDQGGAQLVAFSAAVTSFAGASFLGGNGFIAAFVTGLTVRAMIGKRTAEYVELAESIGQIGAEVTFVVFGAALVWPALSAATVPVVIFVVLILTIGRIFPVAIALWGAKLRAPSVLFIGWFGPRGLASMLFGLLVLSEGGKTENPLFAIVSLAIFASVVAHGITAGPGASAYSRWFNQSGKPEMAEHVDVDENPIRWRINKRPL